MPRSVETPDGMKVRLLETKNQHGQTRDSSGRPFTGTHGEFGDVVVLSRAVARDLIRNGEAVEV